MRATTAKHIKYRIKVHEILRVIEDRLVYDCYFT